MGRLNLSRLLVKVGPSMSFKHCLSSFLWDGASACPLGSECIHICILWTMSLFEIYQVIRITHSFHRQRKRCCQTPTQLELRWNSLSVLSNFSVWLERLIAPSKFNIFQREKCTNMSLFTSHIRMRQNGCLIKKQNHNSYQITQNVCTYLKLTDKSNL